jgi:hypothetical protein
MEAQMANNLQKLIYNLSAISPLSFIFAVIWYIQKRTLTIPIICVCGGIFLILCFVATFTYGKKHIAPIIIHVTDISPHDGWVVAYIISYMLPFASMAIKDFDVIICGIIATIIIVIAPFINSAIPNPLLICRRYHFYQMSTENGISGYLLISRRKLRKAKDVKIIKRVFDFLLIDIGRE